MLAEGDNLDLLRDGYGWLVMTAAIGLVGVVMALSIIIIRRRSRQRALALEQSIKQRRADRGKDQPDIWQASADRYIDRDRLTAEEMAQRPAEDEAIDDGAGASWDGAEEDDPDDDPFGLMDDKPYKDPDPDEDEDDEPGEGDEPWR